MHFPPNSIIISTVTVHVSAMERSENERLGWSLTVLCDSEGYIYRDNEIAHTYCILMADSLGQAGSPFFIFSSDRILVLVYMSLAWSFVVDLLFCL